jgi:hypothetical protein
LIDIRGCVHLRTKPVVEYFYNMTDPEERLCCDGPHVNTST